MAREIIDIGVEGNDGTGDSIRQSFNKTNENFRELYAVFSLEGTIDFTSLGDTPDSLIPNRVPFVVDQAPGQEIDPTIVMGEFSSNSALPTSSNNFRSTDSVNFEYTSDGKIILYTTFERVADDPAPVLSAPLDATVAGPGGSNPVSIALGENSVSEDAVIEFNGVHGKSITVDSLAINKGYADSKYYNSDFPIRLNAEPASSTEYVYGINGYTGDNFVQIVGHPFKRAVNGAAVVYNSIRNDANNLTSGTTYFVRFVNQDEISLHPTRDDALNNSNKIIVGGVIDADDEHTLTDADFDSSLAGNFLSTQAIPRNSAVRRQGDSMEGALFLSDHPGDLSGQGTPRGPEDLQAATKFYVDTTTTSSPTNLFVSTAGDDTMQGVPQGREGTAFGYAFRTINAACRKAEELIRASEPEPGPYFQTITVGSRSNEAVVDTATINNPQNEETRTLLFENKQFLVTEVIGYIEKTYPDFGFDNNFFENKFDSIIDALGFDINKSINNVTADSLTRRAGEQFYADTAGRIAITQQRVQTVDALEQLKFFVDNLLNKRLNQQKNVETVDKVNSVVKTTTDHNFNNGDQVIFRDMEGPTNGGMAEINNQTAYVRVISSDEFELFTDPDLINQFDISSYTAYTTGGRLGLIFQDREDYLDSVKIKPDFRETDDNPDSGAKDDVLANIDTVITIVEDGIEAGSVSTEGSFYNLTLNLQSQSVIDQRTDTIPGKILVGKESGAKGRIIQLVNDDTFELNLLTAKDFKPGEAVEYGNFVKTRQITILVESGIYEEDYPIKVPQNVSIKGDEFRRTIVRPRNRVSQSPWSNIYFYRDLEFDDIPLLEVLHSTVSTVGDGAPQEIAVDDTSWMTVGMTVKFKGNNLLSAAIDRNTEYYITGIIDSADGETDSSGIITVSETESGSDIEFSTPASGRMYVVRSDVPPFINQVGDVQGYFGRHYLTNPYAERSVRLTQSDNPGGFDNAANIIDINKDFIVQEVAEIAEGTVTSAQLSLINDFAAIAVDALVNDLVRGGDEKILEAQGRYLNFVLSGQETAVETAIAGIYTLAEDLLAGTDPGTTGEILADITEGVGEAQSDSTVSRLVDNLNYVFNAGYNAPKLNDADQVDVFMMNDATILRNMTVQGHAGFMVILDPEEQILTKSPYIQVGSAFTKSKGEKAFRGGMYVDAFVGNIPVNIDSVVSAFELEVSSDTDQGLFVRPPQLPCPFYLDGARYQVNAIKQYDPNNGTTTLVLDSSSNSGNGYTGGAGVDIFLQTAGNRSMLGNDFTQINDLGYGLVTNNAGLSEMVSMFTYYCQAAYYAKNGSEIRSLNGSNGYGFFGLVAEGADPNEIPEQVTLSYPMTQPCLSYGVGPFSNLEGDATITVYGCATPPLPESIVQVDHGSTIGVLNYRISTVANLSDTDSDGTVGNSASDELASEFATDQLNTVYELSIKGENASGDFFGQLQAIIAEDQKLSLRSTSVQVFKDVADTQRIVGEKSTAINFDESDNTTYLTTNYADSTSSSLPLQGDEVLAATDDDFQLVTLPISLINLTNADPDDGAKTVGATAGDTKIAVAGISDPDVIERIQRDINGNQPGDLGYISGMIFSYAGKTHSIVNYDDSGSFAYIEIADVAGSEINDPNTTGLAEAIPDDRDRELYAGLPTDATAEITVAISLNRATGHDFTEIGTGGYNTSNYPNDIFGPPAIQPGDDNFYTNANDATSSQIWERRKGRVFVVSTDENGFFRVGKFFSVNQATGSIQFSGEIGVTDFISLRFQQGTDINEFSVDDTFADESNNVVPTERAIKRYIDRVLGYRVLDDAGNEGFPLLPQDGRQGPGFVALDGQNDMEADLDMGGNNEEHKIVNLKDPGSDPTAATPKLYVDDNSKAYDEFNDLRNIELNNSAQNDIVVGTGKNRLFCEITGGTFAVGDIIELDQTGGGNKSGAIVDIENYFDRIEGNLNIITYTPLIKIITSGTITVAEGETITQDITGASGTVLRDFSGVNVIYLFDFGNLASWNDADNYQLTGSVSGDLGTSSQVIDVDGQDFVRGEDIRNAGNTATATIDDGPAPEFANAYEAASSVINVTVNRQETETTYDFQIQDESIINADVAPDAAILQSKLAMQKADTFDEDAGTGWANSSKAQADLGLAKFSDNNFETDEGYVRIRNDGLIFAELQDIDQYTLYGRQTAGMGDPEEVLYSDAVKYGLGLEDRDFTDSEWNKLEALRITTAGEVTVQDGETLTQADTGASGIVQGDVDRDNVIYLRNYTDSVVWDTTSTRGLTGTVSGTIPNSEVVTQSEENTAGAALIKIENGFYVTTEVSISTAADSIARRDPNGKLDGEEIKVQGYDTLRVTDSDTINVLTPGGATVFSSNGTPSTTNDEFVTVFPGSVDVGQTTTSTESNLQTGSSFGSEGWLASDWTYTSFLQAGLNRNVAETGISLGSGSGLEGAGDNVIIGVTNGAPRFYIEDSVTTVKNNLSVESNTTLGSNSSNTVTFNADVSSNILPDNNLTRNIGSTGSRWDTMYAQVFNGTATEAKYADLAENYLADKHYESGTVVVFGGEQEITVHAKKDNTRVAGVVSKNPAHLMNSELTGQHVTAVALQGRLPCKVIGKVSKGDMLVSAGFEGYAIVNNSPAVGTVIGKAVQEKLDDLKGIVEIVVGRT